MSVSKSLILALLASAGMASLCEATFVLPSEWSRGDANSTYQEWDVFSSPPGLPGPFLPDIGVSNPNGAPGLTEVSYPASGSLITGSGNIYSFSAPTSFEITIPNFNLGDGYTTTVALQTRVLGTQIDPATMLIGGVAPSVVELLPDPAAGSVETLWQWELPGNADKYVIAFGSAESSMSFGAAAVDTYATVVPEPSTLALAALALTALTVPALRRRVRA